MILSKTSTYALRILSFMAAQEHELYTAKILHEELEIPDKYLRRLLTHLTAHGFIKSIQGRSGGYLIEKELSKIIIADVLASIDNFESYSACILGYEKCTKEQTCPMHSLWCDSRNKMVATLSTTTLASFKENAVLRK